MDKIYRPQMSQQGLAPTHEVSAIGYTPRITNTCISKKPAFTRRH